MRVLKIRNNVLYLHLHPPDCEADQRKNSCQNSQLPKFPQMRFNYSDIFGIRLLLHHGSVSCPRLGLLALSFYLLILIDFRVRCKELVLLGTCY